VAQKRSVQNLGAENAGPENAGPENEGPSIRRALAVRYCEHCWPGSYSNCWRTFNVSGSTQERWVQSASAYVGAIRWCTNNILESYHAALCRFPS